MDLWLNYPLKYTFKLRETHKSTSIIGVKASKNVDQSEI